MNANDTMNETAANEATFCRCCGVSMNGSDHCGECGCEEFEERCAVQFCRDCGAGDVNSEFHRHF